VWRTQAPSRAAFFSWSATFGKILTLDNLRKRHVIVINRCCMCKKTEESVDHLLLHCDVAFVVWYSLFNRFGLSWVMPRRSACLLVVFGPVDECCDVENSAHLLLLVLIEREIIRALRTWRRPLMNFYPPSITLCIFELRLMCSPYLLAFLISLLVSLVRRFLLYTPSVLRGASRF